MLRLAGAMDETVLLGIGADNTENLFCASGYFIDMASRENDAFRSQYEASFGRQRAAARLDRAVKLRRAAVSGDSRGARAGSLARKPLLSAAGECGLSGRARQHRHPARQRAHADLSCGSQRARLPPDQTVLTARRPHRFARRLRNNT